MSNRPVTSSGFPKDAKVVVLNDFGANSPNAVFGAEFANMVWIGDAGNTTLLLADNNTTLLVTALAVGEWHPMPAFRHVNETGTTSAVVLVGVSYE